MDPFHEWFCLNNRMSFTIDPRVNPADARYYFGRDDIKERLQRQLRRAFIAPGVPKMMVWGAYGSGKTQTLAYLDYYLRTDTPTSCTGKPRTIYLPVEMRSRSDAAHLHMQMMEALSKETVSDWVRRLFEKTSDLNEAVRGLTDDPNIARALTELRAAGDSSYQAWRWLTGQQLKDADLRGLGVTRNLTDVGAGDLVNAVVAIGSLACKVGERLIFLLDEMEELMNVNSGDASESLHQYFRRLAEPANAAVGFLVGFRADVFDDAPQILQRGDIRGRVGPSNYVDIPPLPAVADVKEFMSELLGTLTAQDRVEAQVADLSLPSRPGIYPFDEEAFELLADFATQDPVRALPRYIINAINECAIQAWDDQKHLIDQEIVNTVAQYVFG